MIGKGENFEKRRVVRWMAVEMAVVIAVSPESTYGRNFSRASRPGAAVGVIVAIVQDCKAAR